MKLLPSRRRPPLLLEQEAPRVVEGFLVEEENGPTLKHHHRTYSPPRVSRGRVRAYAMRKQWKPNALFYVLAAGIPLVCVAWIAVLCFPQMVQTDIVIFPRKGEETQSVRVTTVTSDPQLGQGLVRPIEIEESAVTSISTTGTLLHPAQVAQGIVTFYNTTAQTFTLPAGVNLVSTAGVHVVTIVPLTIPASPNLPQISTSHVTARAVVPGGSGNIEVGGINTQCPPAYCGGSKIAVTNITPFQGGQDGQTLRTAVQSDVAAASAPLVTALRARAAHALLRAVQSSERLVEKAPLCNVGHVLADPSVGTPATHVQITVAVTCLGEAYRPDEIREQALVGFLKTTPVLPSGAHVSLQATITSTMPTVSGPVFHVNVHRTWTSTLNLSTLPQRLVGKSPDAARRMLLSDVRLRDVLIQQRLLGLLPLIVPCSLDANALSIRLAA